MPEFSLNYGRSTITVDVPFDHLLGVLEPRATEPLTDPAAAVAQALDNPIDSPPLSDTIRPSDRVLVIVPDITRPAGASTYMPVLLDRLNHLGVPDGQISVLFALGHHRKHTHAEQVGKAFAVALAAVIAAYVVFKWIQRQRLLRSLRIARVSAEELKAWLDGPETPLVVDLRTALDVKAVPYAIPGAVRIAAEDLEQRHPDLPRDREIVLYCS